MLLISYGTRPEWIKIKPIIDELEKRDIKFKILFTGQHSTLINEKFDVRLGIVDGDNRLDSIFTSLLNKDSIFDGIDEVLVQGDTASAFAIALAAFHRQIKIIHLEAGLRTYNKQNPYPEESYRRMISSIASLHLCPTENNKQNLLNEKVNGRIVVVGNTSIDALIPYKDKSYGGNKVIITLHRRENRDIISQWLNEIKILAHENPKLEFIFISHPSLNLSPIYFTNNLKRINPVSHDKMIDLLLQSKIIISDSGGLQEECSQFKIPIIVCRKVTERPESIGITSFMCQDPLYLTHIFNEVKILPRTNIDSPFGTGNTAKEVAYILNGYIGL